ncbi:hypothetical protein ACS0TY_034948 [Phlomoides rotata]
MEEIQSWLANGYNSTSIFSNDSSSNSSATTSSETHSAPTLCEDSTLESTQIISVSHFCIASINTTKAAQITCLAVHNSNLYAATLKEINVFDLTTLSLLHTFGSGSGWVKSIAFGDDGRIFTAHQDCKIRVWNIATSSGKQKHQLISTLPTLKDRFFKCMLAKNYIQVRRHKRSLWIEHADAVSGLATNNGLLYSVSWDKSFKAWKTTSDMRCLGSVTAHSDAVNAVVANPLDGTVITGSADGLIKIWTVSGDGKVYRLLTTLSKHESSVNALALGRVGSVLFSGGGDHLINVWDNGDGENENEKCFVFSCCLKGHGGAILSLVHLKGVLISGSSDTSVRMWKYGNGYSGCCCLAIMEGHSKPVKSVVGIPGDLDHVFTVYSGSLDGEIRAWKVVINF